MDYDKYSEHRRELVRDFIYCFVRALETVESCSPDKIPKHCKMMGFNTLMDSLVSKGIISERLRHDLWGYGDLKLKTGTGEPDRRVESLRTRSLLGKLSRKE